MNYREDQVSSLIHIDSSQIVSLARCKCVKFPNQQVLSIWSIYAQVFCGSAFVPGRKCCAKFTDQPKKKKKQKNADKVTRKENPQLKSEARPSPSTSSSSPERSVDRGARTITRLENKIYLID